MRFSGFTKTAATAAALFFAFSLAVSAGEFKTKQLRNPRVSAAWKTKEAVMKSAFARADVAWPPDEIFMRVFKRRLKDGRLEDGAVELWARSGSMKKFVRVKTYPICSASGDPGPKRAQGDMQVPEGFYTISGFNPASSYHLSMRIDYPNESDRRLGRRGNLGGDIFIHGDCVSIGCIAVTDPLIEELYVAATAAKDKSGATIRINIFPLPMDTAGMAVLEELAGGNAALTAFWRNIKRGYDAFEKTGAPPKPRVRADGLYEFQ